MTTYDICFSSDDGYAEQLAVSITSILDSSDEDEKFNFYILDGGITEKNKKRILKLKQFKNFNIDFINMNICDFENCPMLKDIDPHYSNYHVTIPTYFRFKLSSIFLNLDKILYLDCDIIAFASLKELYNLDLQNYYAAMVKDIDCQKESKRLNLSEYFNAGIMLINLAKWRHDNIEDTLFEYAKNNMKNIVWQDQDIMNTIFKDNILEISDKWNFQMSYENPENKIDTYKQLEGKNILHFAGKHKPWLNIIDEPVFDIYYSYLAKILWTDNVYQYKTRFFDNKLHKELYHDGRIAEEFKKVYDYVDHKDKDSKDIFDIRNKNMNDLYFSEQTKIYEYINSKMEMIFEKYNKMIEEYERRLNNQTNQITFLENELEKLGFIDKSTREY